MSVDCVAFHVKTELDRVGDPHIIGSQAHMSFFGGFLPEAICPLLPNQPLQCGARVHMKFVIYGAFLSISVHFLKCAMAFLFIFKTCSIFFQMLYLFSSIGNKTELKACCIEPVRLSIKGWAGGWAGPLPHLVLVFYPTNQPLAPQCGPHWSVSQLSSQIQPAGWAPASRTGPLRVSLVECPDFGMPKLGQCYFFGH